MAKYSKLLLLLILLTLTYGLTASKSDELLAKQQLQEDETVLMVLPDKEELPEDPRTECVDSNYWTCSIVHRRLVTNQNDVDIERNQQMDNGYTQIRGLRMYFFNKMSREGGTGWENRLYVSGKIYWTFHPWRRDTQMYSLNVWIGPLTGPQVLYVLELRRPKKLRQGAEHQHTASMFIRLNKMLPAEHRLRFGHSYKARITVNEVAAHQQVNHNGSALQEVYSASTTLDVPQLYASDDASACSYPNASAQGVQQQQRKKMASKWTGAFDALHFHRFDSSMSVRFFGAPPSYCIEQYKVAVYLKDLILVASHTVKQKDLKRNADGVLIGQTNFFQLKKGESYTVKILPDEKNSAGDCVCAFDGRCGCVRIQSQAFSPPSLPILEDWSGQQHNSSDVPLQVVPSKDPSGILYLVVAISLFLLTLLLLSLALLLRLCRHSRRDRKHNLLLVFNGKRATFDGNHLSGSSASSDSTSDSRKPLLKKCQSVLLVSGEQASNSAQLEVLAKVLQGLGVRVYYCRWEQNKLEENMQLWVHTVLAMVDKIFLFHEPRGRWMLSEEGRKNVVERDIFDDVFHCLHSSLVYSDPRIIHLKWTANQQAMFFSPENMYLLPRDLSHIFTAMKLQLSTVQIKDYQDEFCRVASLGQPTKTAIMQQMEEQEQSSPCSQPAQLPAERPSPPQEQDSGNQTLEHLGPSPQLVVKEKAYERAVMVPPPPTTTTCLEVEKRHLTNKYEERTGFQSLQDEPNDSGIVV